MGRIAAMANVKTPVLNHFIPPDDKSLTPDVWADAVGKTFGGNIVGEGPAPASFVKLGAEKANLGFERPV